MNRYQQSNHNTNTSMEDARSDAVERVLAAVPEILDAMIEKAKAGSQQHAKFLFDWAKLEPSSGENEEENGAPSLAKFLLEKLREDTGESVSANATDVL